MPPIIEPYLDFNSKLIPLTVTLLGALIIFLIYKEKISIFINQTFSINFLCFIWFLTPISTQLSIILPLKSSLLIFKNLDQGWNEFIGPQGIFNISIHNSKYIIITQKIIPTIQLFIVRLIIIPLIIILYFNSLNKA
jgi:hypothetical protein